MATATAIATVASTGAQLVQQRKSRKERQRASALEQRAAEVRNLRERKRAVAARQRAAAQAAVAGEQAGVGATSGVIQAEQSSAGSQFAANVGFAQEIQALGGQRRAALEKAGAAEGRAGLVQAIGSAAVSGINSFSQFQEANKRKDLLDKQIESFNKGNSNAK